MTSHIIDLDTHRAPTVTTRRFADLPGRVVAGDPQPRTALHFVSRDGALTAGVWTSTPGKWHACH